MPWPSCYTIHNGQAKAIYARVSRPAVKARVPILLTGDLSALFCSVRTRQHLLPSAAQHFSEDSAGPLPCLIAPFSVSLKCRSASMRRTAASRDASVATNTITENPFLMNPRQRILANDSSTWRGAITAHSCAPSSRDTLQTDTPHSWISVPLTTHTQGLHLMKRLLPSRPVAHLQNWRNFCLHPLKY